MTAAIAQLSILKEALPLDHNSDSVNISVHRILRSPFNRAPDLNDDFVANVAQHGVIQPIIVRTVKIWLDRLNELPKSTSVKIGDEVYELVAGERRWLASKKTNRASIPAIIRTLTDTQAMEIQIAENDHRENYSVMDRAEAYARLRTQYMEEHKSAKGWTEEKCMDLIASRCNKEEIKGRTVQQIIALQKLHPFCQAALRQREMEASHGYEICRRPEEEQLELLKWLRKETQHSQGDVPSVRRLKREIVDMDRVADEKRRQEKLFKDPQPGTSTTRVPTVGEVAAQTSAAKTSPQDERTKNAIASYKPPTKAELKAEEARRQKEAKAQRDGARNARINKKYQGLFFAAFARKAQINSRFLTHAIPDLVHSSIDGNTYDEFEIDAVFGQRSLGWPAPADGNAYSAEEVCNLTKKHTRGFTPGLLAAVIATIHMTPAASEKLIRYFGVDPKKLRKQASTAVKDEEVKARTPKEPATQREKQLHYAVRGNEPKWKTFRRTGMSNSELREHLAKSWGDGQGMSSTDFGSIWCKGGKDPSIVFNYKRDQPLRGVALITEVRDLLKIPEKGDVDA